MPRNFIGIDLGGTKIHALKVAEGGKTLGEKYTPTSKLGRDAVLSQMSGVIDYLKDKNTAAIGICLPGQVNAEMGLVIDLPNLKGWKNFAVAKSLRKTTSRPILTDSSIGSFKRYPFLRPKLQSA